MDKAIFIKESIKITLFCLSVVLISMLFKADHRTILIAFNMAVMSAAATFVPLRKSVAFISLGSFSIVIAILLGGLAGQYLPSYAGIIGIFFAALAFCLSKNKLIINILATSALMFIIFSFNPFGVLLAFHYLLYGLGVIILFIFFHVLFETNIYAEKSTPLFLAYQDRWLNVSIVVIALIAGLVIEILLSRYYQLSHLYWIPLTILVIVQGASGKTIKISLVRITVNMIGALVVIVLYSYCLPDFFWLNIALLTIFLFCIFAFGYSYALRTFFIEVFVLSFTHFLGQYHNTLAYDRVLLTCIGGGLVIISSLFTLGIYRLMHKRRDHLYDPGV